MPFLKCDAGVPEEAVVHFEDDGQNAENATTVFKALCEGESHRVCASIGGTDVVDPYEPGAVHPSEVLSEPTRRRDSSTGVQQGEHDLVGVSHRQISGSAGGNIEGTLGNWVAKARKERERGSSLSTDERGELGELRRETAQLRMERDLFKRSLAFWVKESTS